MNITIDGVRRRRYATGRTAEEALERAKTLEVRGRTHDARLRTAHHVKMHLGDHATAQVRRARALEYAEAAIRIGRLNGWSPDYIAAVVVASLTPNRLRHGISGPCVYCGDPLANEVDHIMPVIRGGTDDPANLVSACHRCNSRKADQEPAKWRASA